MTSFCKKLLKPAFKAVSNIGLINPHTPHEIELMEAGIKPVTIIYSFDVSSKMKELIQIGKIVHIGDYHNKKQGHTVQVYAQSNKIEEGKEIYARYYKNSEGYPPLESEEAFKRIGELLGYTENDIALGLCKKYQNIFINAIMLKTNDWRCKIRKKYMINYSDNLPS